MAGPAIRAFEVARALSRVADVTLASDNGSTLNHPELRIEQFSEAELRSAVDTHDVLIFQGFTLSTYPWIAQTDRILVADLYDPIHLEVLVQTTDLTTEERRDRLRISTDTLTQQLERADYFICASEKQRDLWLGYLSSAGRINQHTYDQDPSLRSLIDVVPFGIQDTEPTSTRHAIKDVVPGISSTDKVLIWGGGIYNWFDPLTLIRAVDSLSGRHPDLKLFFLGVQHPNPQVPAMRMATEAQELAEQLGLVGRQVFFNQEWVPYESRADYLLDADLGVSTHFDHVETAFSFRTRMLDYLWAGLPIVATEGDSFADLIRAEQLGAVVPPNDTDALAAALENVLYSEGYGDYVERIKAYRDRLRWSEALRPLVSFCSNPHHAADYASPEPSSRELERRQLKELVAVLSDMLPPPKEDEPDQLRKIFPLPSHVRHPLRALRRRLSNQK